MSMAYKIIQPPFTLKFREMTRKELKEYYHWFMGILPERVDELARAVRKTSGFESWQADATPASLDLLGEWLAVQVETRPRTEAEIQEIKGRSKFPIDIPTVELTNRTFSLAMDTGMYISQVMLQNNPSLRWDQQFGNKRFIDYGQPVLVEFSTGPFNPVHMMVTLAYGIKSKLRAGRGLRDVYEIWVKMVRPEPGHVSGTVLETK